MNRTRMTIKLMATALVFATAVAPNAGAAQQESGAAGERTATELGQAIGEPGTEAAAGDQAAARTATELGQAIGEPGQAGAAQAQLATRTATELGQTVAGSGGSSVAQADPTPQAPAADSGGFDWGDAAMVAGGLAILAAIGGTVLLAQRRGTARRSRAPATSS
jgi:hypothetical protein